MHRGHLKNVAVAFNKIRSLERCFRHRKAKNFALECALYHAKENRQHGENISMVYFKGYKCHLDCMLGKFKVKDLPET